MDTFLVKITFISGLQAIVLDEIAQYPELAPSETYAEAIVFSAPENLEIFTKLRSIINAFLMIRDEKINPYYLSNHKSILGNLVAKVLATNPKTFQSFRISCAGSDSDEIRSIKNYITETFKISYLEDDADLKIFIGKSDDVWEVSIPITNRPLSVRDYRVINILGGVNPTIAYAMNTFCDLANITSYLNICSGGATFLIEAAQINPNLKLVGFDNNGKTISEAVKNIKQAGLIKTIQLHKADLFNSPQLGIFDGIVSDPPFGMLVSKHADLEKFYQAFVHYCEKTLNPNGTLVVYTTQDELLEELLNKSLFQITTTLDIKFLSNVNAYLYPKIFVCRFKK